jgi:hypothetical protein
VNDSLNIPNKEIAKKLGFGNYDRLRLAYETEKDKYPATVNPVDAGGQQMDPNKTTSQKKKGMIPGQPVPPVPGQPVPPVNKVLVKKPIK